MDIVDQYRKVTESIREINRQISLLQIEIDELEHEYCPKEVHGINYERIGSSSIRTPMDIEKVRVDIETKISQVKKYEADYIKLEKRKEELEKIVSSYGGVKSEIILLKCKGYTNRRIADKLGYSVRHIERF